MNNLASPQIGMSGQYRIEVRRTGQIVKETDWFDNLITDNGLELIGKPDAAFSLSYCQVGNGTSIPAVNQTALDNKIGVSLISSYGSPITSNSGAPNYIGSRTYTYVFTQGAVVGNVSEVGISPVITGNLFSRALITNTNGDPTTLTLLAIDQLTIYYKINIQPTLTSNISSVNISGVPYTYTIKPIALSSFFHGSLYKFGFTNDSAQYSTFFQTTGYTPASTSITNSSSGTAFSSSPDISAYITGSRITNFTYTIPIATGNYASGIIGIDLALGYANGYQPNAKYNITFDAPIIKTNTQVLTLSASISWGRG